MPMRFDALAFFSNLNLCLSGCMGCGGFGGSGKINVPIERNDSISGHQNMSQTKEEPKRFVESDEEEKLDFFT